jgi:DNA-binding beta-propeller fold protein YncE
LLTKDLTQPNGLSFSPDGKHLYIDDSKNRNIRVYVILADDNLNNGRIFGEEPGGKARWGARWNESGPAETFLSPDRAASGCGMQAAGIWEPS